MGGATFSHTGLEEKVLEHLKNQILLGYQSYQLYPDSDISLFNPDTKEQKIFNIEIKETEGKIEVILTEKADKTINLATAAAIETTANYIKPNPKKGEWIGCAHVHT